MNYTLGNVKFNKDTKTFEIQCGDIGIYNYSDLMQSRVVFEDAKYYQRSKPFSHQLLISTFESFFITIKNCYVGVEIVLKNGEKKYIYVSNNMQRHHTDMFNRDVEIANKLRDKFKKIIVANRD